MWVWLVGGKRVSGSYPRPNCTREMEGYSLYFCLTLLVTSAEAFPPMPKGNPIPAIQGLVSRILGPKYVDNFLYVVISDENGFDVFEVDVALQGDKPVLRGNNGVALASAFNFYLKYFCNCSISWGRDGTGDQLRLPTTLPLPREKIRIVFPNKYRYEAVQLHYIETTV